MSQMMNQIKADFADAVRRETGAEVVFTQNGADTFSVFTEDGERFAAVVALICRVPGVTLDSSLIATPAEGAHVPFDGAEVEVVDTLREAGWPAEYYAYFRVED